MPDLGPANEQQPDLFRVCLGLVDWFAQWEHVRLKRHCRRKWIPVCQMRVLDGSNPQKYTETYWQKIRQLRQLRNLVLVEGCKLGSSPVEMGRVLDGVDDAVCKLATWDKELWRPDEDLLTIFEGLWINVYRHASPLRESVDVEGSKGGEFQSNEPLLPSRGLHGRESSQPFLLPSGLVGSGDRQGGGLHGEKSVQVAAVQRGRQGPQGGTQRVEKRLPIEEWNRGRLRLLVHLLVHSGFFMFLIDLHF